MIYLAQVAHLVPSADYCHV